MMKGDRKWLEIMAGFSIIGIEPSGPFSAVLIN
jgi:hypothetical protein